MKPHILSFESFDDWDSVALNELFTVHQFPASGEVADLPDEVKEKIRAFAFKGHSRLDADIMDAFPNLELVANYGVGYDTIDVAHASSRSIKVTNTPDVLTNDVADLAVGMLLSLNRGISGASDWVTSGQWASAGAYPLQRTLSGASVGIAGLGRIGRAIGNRLAAFETDIHYYARSKKDTPDWTFHDNLISLAQQSDILIVAVSGGPDTQKIISSGVIAALGSDGLLINIARGSTMDEDALINALQTRQIRGAALDVFNNEPDIDSRFMQLDNVLLQPHHSSGTIETRKRMGALQRQNLIALFNNTPLVTPVN
ncbi:hydroxyacid dehydrogenase [Chromatiales bacterium (ex Bugula neritina AB1)]|nr:hydroxyacid dehydrogenase [Chromatiales bacterium (ex Bugula neritina AB1)]